MRFSTPELRVEAGMRVGRKGVQEHPFFHKNPFSLYKEVQR